MRVGSNTSFTVIAWFRDAASVASRRRSIRMKLSIVGSTSLALAVTAFSASLIFTIVGRFSVKFVSSSFSQAVNTNASIVKIARYAFVIFKIFIFEILLFDEWVYSFKNITDPTIPLHFVSHPPLKPYNGQLQLPHWQG